MSGLILSNISLLKSNKTPKKITLNKEEIQLLFHISLNSILLDKYKDFSQCIKKGLSIFNNYELLQDVELAVEYQTPLINKLDDSFAKYIELTNINLSTSIFNFCLKNASEQFFNQFLKEFINEAEYNNLEEHEKDYLIRSLCKSENLEGLKILDDKILLNKSSFFNSCLFILNTTMFQHLINDTKFKQEFEENLPKTVHFLFKSIIREIIPFTYDYIEKDLLMNKVEKISNSVKNICIYLQQYFNHDIIKKSLYSNIDLLNKEIKQFEPWILNDMKPIINNFIIYNNINIYQINESSNKLSDLFIYNENELIHLEKSKFEYTLNNTLNNNKKNNKV